MPRTHRSPPRLAVAALLAAALTACASQSSGAGASTSNGAGQPSSPASPAAEQAPDAPPAAPPQIPNPYAEVPKTEWPANYQTLQIKVSGMGCPIRCVREVKEMLSAVPGVLHVTVDYDEREVAVDVVPGTDPESVLRGLKGPYSGRLM